MNETGQIAIVLTTVANRDDANQVANALVDQCLAACVQVEGPITSYYRWAGEVQTESEFRLVIKTTCRMWPLLKDKLQKLHPYEEPQIVLLTIDDASAGYLSWVNDQTS